MSKTITRAEAEASFGRIAAIIAKAQADLREEYGDDVAAELDIVTSELAAARAAALEKILGAHLGG